MQSGVDLSKLLELPDEAIFIILANSLPEDINAVRRINIRLRHIATDNHLWKAKFQIHFPHLFNELNQIPDINWYAEFADAYRREYTTVSEHMNVASFLPLRIRRQFSLVKEGRAAELKRDLTFADLKYTDVNQNTITDWARKCNNRVMLDAVFELVLVEYTDIKKTDLFGRNMLHWAIECRQSSNMITKLLHVGVDANAAMTSGMTALFLAIAVSGPEIVRKLIDKGVDITIRNEFGKSPQKIILTPLIYAILRKKEDVVAVLLEKGADPNIAVEGDDVRFNDGIIRGDKPLHVAVKIGQIEIVKALLDSGADVNAVDNDGYTPLIIAASSGKTDILELLIARGADINRSGHDHQITALIYASLRGHQNVVEVLVRHHADRDRILGNDILFENISFPVGYKAIHIAIKLGYLGIARTLLVDSVDVNIRGNSNNTPMMTASIYGHISIVEYLIDRGADINARATSGATALLYAIIKRQDHIVDLLLEHHANVSLPLWRRLENNEGIDIVAGDTALHIAAKFGNEELVNKLLIANESIVEVRNSKGETPADVARANSKLGDMLKLLKYYLEINRLEDNTHKKSVTLFGHQFNFGDSVGAKKAAVSEFLRLYRNNSLDESILTRHAALNNGELGKIARNIFGK